MQRILNQCVLIVLIAAALAMTFAVPDTRLPMSAWVTLTLLSKAIGILLWAAIFNSKALWSSAKRT